MEAAPYNINLLPYFIIFLAHCSHTANTRCDLFFHAFFNDCRRMKIRLDFAVASAAHIHSLMRHFYRKYGLFAAYLTYQENLSFRQLLKVMIEILFWHRCHLPA